MEDWEDQEGVAEGKAAPVASASPWFAIKVALGGMALHLLGYAADCGPAGDVAAVVFFAGWLFGVRNLPESEEGKRP